MKKLIAILATVLSLMASGVNADNVLYIKAKVDTVSTANDLIKVGDDLDITLNYNSSNVITLANVKVNNSNFNFLRKAASPPTFVYIQDDPNQSIVQWMGNGNGFSFDLASHTVNGAIPCATDFDLGNSVSIYFRDVTASGAIVAVPRKKIGL